MTYRINIGDAIPLFRTMDQEEEPITTEDLIGSPVIIYFYPKNDTPGCTKEACSFRDKINEFDSEDTLVIGISPDSSESHVDFMEKHGLNFTLIPDPKLEICKKFDVIRSQNPVKIERTTFLVDADGIVRWLERPVEVEGHVERVLKALRNLQKEQYD